MYIYLFIYIYIFDDDDVDNVDNVDNDYKASNITLGTSFYFSFFERPTARS